ncbi:MauE/DoxX family redox-associated membrane protein [Aquihabitans daechungensis]|uniref:MauE/DoxX family redox-associated membrane protein n=1 Tax=Aquihabitans daechungensis TaxID=1052257 RepID=UPI003B9ED479
MSPLAGLVFAAALLLGAAGVGKATSPGATRIALRSAGLPGSVAVARGLGVVEVLIALAAILVGGPIATGLVAVSYLGFAWFARRLQAKTRGAAPCGCFGASSAPVGTLHVAVNLVIALGVGVAAVDAPGPIWEAAGDTPWAGVPFVGLVLLLAWLLFIALTALPETLAAAKAAAPTAGAAS